MDLHEREQLLKRVKTMAALRGVKSKWIRDDQWETTLGEYERNPALVLGCGCRFCRVLQEALK